MTIKLLFSALKWNNNSWNKHRLKNFTFWTDQLLSSHAHFGKSKNNYKPWIYLTLINSTSIHVFVRTQISGWRKMNLFSFEVKISISGSPNLKNLQKCPVNNVSWNFSSFMETINRMLCPTCSRASVWSALSCLFKMATVSLQCQVRESMNKNTNIYTRTIELGALYTLHVTQNYH